MPEARSLRFVLTLWYSVVLLAAFFLFGAAVYVYLKRMQDAALQGDLREEVDWISRLVDVDRRRIAGGGLEALSEDVEGRITEHFLANPRNYIVMLESSSGNMLFESGKGGEAHPSADRIPPGGTAFLTLYDSHGDPVRAAARRDDPFIIQVAYTQGASEAVLRHLLSIFEVLTPVVREVSERARSITASNLSGRIPPRAVRDELGELITTINDMIARLENSFTNIREFSLSIAHELKTPLTILRGESELALAHPLTPAEAEELASVYLEETSRLSRIVDDLLTLARVESGQMSLNLEEVELHRLLADIHEDALILAAGKQLTVSMDQNDEARLNADPARLRQLFRALVSNAVRYTDPGGAIRIRSRRAGAEVLVSIEDTGIGIPPESLGRIFERFYRVDEARTRARGGSGLGLALARWIAEAHHGAIDVRSTPGKGSCFTVRIPLSPPA